MNGNKVLKARDNMSDENLKQVRKYIDETISKTIKASRKLNANYFKMTERRLYAYPMLEQNIEFWRFTELHYSQTGLQSSPHPCMFWRFTELHYSQTNPLAA